VSAAKGADRMFDSIERLILKNKFQLPGIFNFKLGGKSIPSKLRLRQAACSAAPGARCAKHSAAGPAGTLSVPSRHEFLHRDGKLYRSHNGGKFEQDAITGGLDDAADAKVYG
jgi:hypothetical protein